VWNKYPFLTRYLGPTLGCLLLLIGACGASSCVANPTPHPADEDRAYGAEQDDFANTGAAESLEGSAMDAMGAAPQVSMDIAGEDATHVDLDVENDVGPEDDADAQFSDADSDADAIDEIDCCSPQRWDDVEEDVSESDPDTWEVE